MTTDARRDAIRNPRISIRARIMILALVLILPPMGERVIRLENARGERISHAIEEVASLAQRGTEAQSEIVNATRALLQVVARAYGMLPNGQNCAPLLAGFAADVPWITGLSIVGANDRIACATSPASIGIDLSDRDYLRAARQSRGFVLSAYLIERVNDHHGVMAAYPVPRDGGKPDTVILASMDLQWVERFAQLIEARKGATAFLIDSQGTLVSQLPAHGEPAPRSAPDSPLIRSALSQNSGALLAAGLDGVHRIYGFSALPGTDTRIVVGIDEHEALGLIDRELSIAYFQLIMFGVVAMLVTWFLGERFIVAPIHLLTRTAASIGRGELKARPARTRWTAEFAPLAAALDDMASKLAERERDLRAANHQLQELALLDGLSGLPNRRAFDLRLASMWLASDPATPITLLMIDVDHFKLFNDTNGHVEGDTCLRTISKSLGTVTREEDFAARYGGEEFVMLMAGIGSVAAEEIAERLRLAIEALRLPHPAVPLGTVSVSIGVATLSPGTSGGEQILIESADAALYEAKRRGRNSVAVWEPTPLAKAS